MMAILKAKLSGIGGLSADLSGGLSMSADIILPKEVGTEPYTGAYEFTPSTSEQTIEINGKRATSDITIHPIPQNYGLITWDGSTLTVS